jgi:hypothetical protein
MTRVETGAGSTEKLKKEIKHQVEVDIRKVHRRKKMLLWGSSLILVVVVGGGLFFAGAWAVAATGLYDVPMISSWAFHVPVPIHEVHVEESVDEVSVLEQMRTEINDLISTQYTGQIQASEANVVIDEELLTTFLIQNISGAVEHAGAEIVKSQIAIEPTGMEIFLHIAQKERPVYISLIVIPEVVDNDINLDIRSARLGNLPLPTWAAGYALNTFFGSALSVLQVPIVGFVHLDSIDLIYGKLRLNGAIEYTTFE